MKHTPESVREQVSALVDDHLQGDAFARTVDQLGVDGDLQATWRAYHLVGDVLRAGRHSACTDNHQFLARFQARLAAEPVPSMPEVIAVAQPAAKMHIDAANEPVFRWKLVAGVASLAAAAAIGWNWAGNGAGVSAPGPQLALQQPTTTQPSAAAAGSVLTAMQQNRTSTGADTTRVLVGNGSGAPQVMLRDPRLDQLLEAHRQAAGGAQMPSGFLRNATFEGASR
jgi:sigma-E factor negative regulatory protein RseA